MSLSSTVRLPSPDISLTSPDAGLVWGPDGAVVTRGYSFVLKCSIDTIFSRGHFFLFHSGSNPTVTKQAVNNSASFDFPAAEYEHQGNYSCVYEATVSTRKFNSTEAAPVSITVKCKQKLLHFINDIIIARAFLSFTVTFLTSANYN